MSRHKKLPADYAIDALSSEALRRGRKMSRPDYSYGKLVADTTEAERERIVDDYRAGYGKRRSNCGTRSIFHESDKDRAGE